MPKTKKTRNGVPVHTDSRGERERASLVQLFPGVYMTFFT